MVSARFFCLQHYNYRNPLHKIYCSRQGNRSKRRNKWIHVERHTRRSEKRKVTNCKRLVSKSSTSDATSTVEQERVRRISARECGPPLFEINDVVTIVKDTSPGASFMHSYDKIGRVAKVVVGNINTYTVKVLFENYSEAVDELWLRKCDPEGMDHASARASKKQRTLKGKNIVIANLQGKLRVERKRSS